ncbi:hypothetical protein N9N67_06750 [Bacteriovoracaceae bacterium]|nr:hypothetical protein [Bacteriovoracaceae bacterium]
MKLLASFLILISLSAHSEVLLGTGLHSETQGRLSPMLYGAYEYENNAIVFNSVGVASKYHYHSAYQLGYFLNEDWGTFLEGKLSAGVGVVIFHREFGYRDDTDDEDGTVSYDTNVGGGVRVRVDILDHFFIGVEGTFGVAGLYPILLSFQNTQVMTFGVMF